MAVAQAAADKDIMFGQAVPFAPKTLSVKEIADDPKQYGHCPITTQKADISL